MTPRRAGLSWGVGDRDGQLRERDRRIGIERPDGLVGLVARYRMALGIVAAVVLPTLSLVGAFDRLLPHGIAAGAAREARGLIVYPGFGEAPRFVSEQALRDGYIDWVHADQAMPRGACVFVDEAARQAIGAAPGAAAARFWARLRIEPRLGRSACGTGLGPYRDERVASVIAAHPLGCGVETFVARGFRCPRAGVTHDSILPPGLAYPAEAQRRGMEGTVRVRVNLDATGTPDGCDILASSGHDLLDRQTCKLVGTDPGFAPPGPGPLERSLTVPVVWRLQD